MGKRVLLIDADFRKGQLNRYFGVPKEDGLFEVLSGTIPLEQVRRHSVSEGVDFISTGAVTFDPSELLASPVFGQTLRELSTSTTWWCWIPRRCCPRRMQQWWAAMRPR